VLPEDRLQRLHHQPRERVVFRAEPQLLGDDPLLVGQFLLAQLQAAHPRRLHGEHLQVVRRRHLGNVDRLVERRERVVVSSPAIVKTEDGVLFVLVRRPEHQVLEQVCQSTAAVVLVRRADVVPDLSRHQLQPRVGEDGHLEAVVQRVMQESAPVGQRQWP